MDDNEDTFTPYAIIPKSYSTDVGPIQVNAMSLPMGGDVSASLRGSPNRVGYTQQGNMGIPYAATNVGGVDLTLTPKDIQAGVNVGDFTASGTYSKEAGPALNANYRKMFENGVIDVNGNLTPQGYQLMLQGQVSF